MQITIDPFAVLTTLLWLTAIALLAYNTVLFRRQARTRKRIRQGFRHMGAGQRVDQRMRDLFFRPMEQHNTTHPGDVKCGLFFFNAEGTSLCTYHADASAPHKWSEGPGLDLVRTIAQGVAVLEQHEPGIIPILQVLLDEEKEKVAERTTRQIIR